MSRKRDNMMENNETYPKSPGGASHGFFAVLMVCLIAVGGVAAATFSDHTSDVPLSDEADTVTTVTTAAVTTTTAQPVAVSPATTTVTTTAVPTTTQPTEAEVLFVLPLSNKVLTPYSEQPVYNETMDNYRAHTAVDFDGEEGQPVRPLANGRVTAVEQDALWGGCVTVDHGEGVVTVYRGVEAQVQPEQEVTTDDTLGLLDAVPCESKLGPHLHLELYKDGTAADPSVLFDKQLITES